MKDLGASILARLKMSADKRGEGYQRVLRYFFQEELIRRLSKSKYANNLILKGGLFIFNYTNFDSRSTVDVDFSAKNLDNSFENMEKVIAEILSVQTDYSEAVTLKASKAQAISVQQKYPGVRFQITGCIKRVRVPFDLDIGFGDTIVPGPELRIIQTQIDDFEKPQVLTYSLESTIAEKFDALLQRFEFSSRMKDFYDIHYLAHKFDFKGEILEEAISASLTHRNTHVDGNSFDRIIQLENDDSINVRWRHFQKIIKNPNLAFSVVLHTMEVFLHPVIDALVADEKFVKNWDSASLRWEASPFISSP
jgi:predicted nucleotidyltransferase component of viral defense system